MADLAAKAGAASNVDAKQRAERDAQWIGDWSDELTVAIALKEWDKAVKLVETGSSGSMFFRFVCSQQWVFREKQSFNHSCHGHEAVFPHNGAD